MVHVCCYTFHLTSFRPRTTLYDMLRQTCSCDLDAQKSLLDWGIKIINIPNQNTRASSQPQVLHTEYKILHWD